MSTFNLATNKIINGICEWCGIKATECEHYKTNPKPLDETKKLELSENPVPKTPTAPVMPLTETEKVASIDEAMKKKAEYDLANNNTKLKEDE